MKGEERIKEYKKSRNEKLRMCKCIYATKAVS